MIVRCKSDNDSVGKLKGLTIDKSTSGTPPIYSPNVTIVYPDGKNRAISYRHKDLRLQLPNNKRP